MVTRLTAKLSAVLLAHLFAFAWAAAGSVSARAQAVVDLQLVLAVDVSGSVSDERFRLQQQGYAKAFRDWRVLDAIRAGGAQAIAVTMTQWTGPAQQAQVVPWMIVTDETSILAFADAIERTTRELYGGGTSISGAIDHAVMLFRGEGGGNGGFGDAFKGGRLVVDISGDGANNRGRPAAEARDEAVAKGITINGLPILALEPGLDQYYQANVIGGPNAFMVVAESYETFAEAVVRKLITEIAARSAGRKTAIGAPRDKGRVQ